VHAVSRFALFHDRPALETVPKAVDEDQPKKQTMFSIECPDMADIIEKVAAAKIDGQAEQ